MAALFDEMEAICCLACDSHKIAYICIDCTGPRLHLCKSCYKGHVSAGHKVIEINEYQKNPSRYLLAEERECRKHKGEQLKLVCTLCNMLLCLMCTQDSSVTCEKMRGGKGKHETGPLKSAVESRKKIIDESLGTATHNEADALAAIHRCKQKKEDALAQHNRVTDEAENDERKLITAVRANTKNVIDNSARNLDMVNAQADRSIGDMEDFLENLRRTRKEAEDLKSSSADVNVHRLTPSVVDRLTTPFALPEPNVPTLKLEPPTWLNEADEVKKLVGSLVSYVKGDQLVQGEDRKEKVRPTECCVITTTKGLALVEAYPLSGLFLAVPGEAKKKISAEGVGLRSVCTSPDGKIIYSATNKNTICMYTVEDDSLNLVKEVTVGGAKYPQCIRASPTTGNLAVLDNEAQRITLLDKDFLFLGAIENVLKGGNPSKLVWSPCGEHLFITIWEKGDVNPSVMKLKVESAEITWRKSLDYKPTIVRHFGGRLYITHFPKSKVTVMSAEDGSIIKTITAPGCVREMRKSPHADVEMVYYP